MQSTNAHPINLTGPREFLSIMTESFRTLNLSPLFSKSSVIRTSAFNIVWNQRCHYHSFFQACSVSFSLRHWNEFTKAPFSGTPSLKNIFLNPHRACCYHLHCCVFHYVRDVFGSPGELIKRGFCLPTADPPSTLTAAVVSCNDTIAGLSNSTLSQTY